MDGGWDRRKRVGFATLRLDFAPRFLSLCVSILNLKRCRPDFKSRLKAAEDRADRSEGQGKHSTPVAALDSAWLNMGAPQARHGQWVFFTKSYSPCSISVHEEA